MEVINFNGRGHILKRIQRNGTDSEGHAYPDPDFRGTGMALCGVLKKGQNLKKWMDEKRKRREALGL